MKRVLFLLFIASLSLSLMAQTRDIKIQQSLEEAKAKLVEFDTERLLDSLDQEKLPRLVSGGILGNANLSNFIINRDHHTMSSYMRIGGELGGFLDFAVTKNFAIQPQVIFTAHQNYFAVTDSANHLWSFGVDIPIYFLGRFGNMEKGYIQFGGGIFTHFTFASNIAGKFKNLDEQPGVAESARRRMKAEENPTYDYSRLYSLHNNHFGVCAIVGYEFPIGIQINAQYKVSLSDIAGFYSENKGKEIADALIYPQSVSLGIGYRWK